LLDQDLEHLISPLLASQPEKGGLIHLSLSSPNVYSHDVAPARVFMLAEAVLIPPLTVVAGTSTAESKSDNCRNPITAVTRNPCLRQANCVIQLNTSFAAQESFNSPDG
jgi:hypothetical protein